MIIGVLKEGAVNENRVALIPAHVSELLKINADVMVERGAGAAAGFSDAEYQEKQCRLAAREDILSKADILLAVRAAAANTKTGEADIRALKEGGNCYRYHGAICETCSIYCYGTAETSRFCS